MLRYVSPLTPIISISQSPTFLTLLKFKRSLDPVTAHYAVTMVAALALVRFVAEKVSVVTAHYAVTMVAALALVRFVAETVSVTA